MWQNYRQRVLRWYKAVCGIGKDFSKGQKIRYLLEAAGVTLFFGLFFYRSLWAAPFLLPVGLFYYMQRMEKRKRAWKEQLRSEFKDAILTVSANLRAGYAVENAIREAMSEMKALYGKDSPVYQEFYKMIQGMANNLSVESQMEQFAKRTQLEEIQEFADVFFIAKRSGGNLTEIIGETAGIISEKIEVEKEIQTLLSSKRLELNIMAAVPFAIVLYVSAASSGYFDVLYTSLTGRGVMTICLAVYLCAYSLGMKIAEIPV